MEIDPVASKSGTRLFRQRAVTYDADNIASCDIQEEKEGKILHELSLHINCYEMSLKIYTLS